MTVAMRDDDVDLLHAMASSTGLGVVRSKDQRGNSQVAWVVYRKDDAAALAAYLRRYPLRSRKRHDFDVWSCAVDYWHGCDADRVNRMQQLRLSIREARRYRSPSSAGSQDNRDSAGFDDWLGGFLAGDGYLGVGGGATRLTVKLRADDAPLLAWIRNITCAGTICGPYRNRAAHPSVAWNITRTSELLTLAARLDGRIPGRKRLEFAVWRRAVEARADRTTTASRRRSVIDDAEQELRELRRYRPG
jgi:hypothetical protein